MSNNLSNINKCGLKEIIIFIVSLVFGTAYAIYSKILMEIQVPGNMDDTASTSFHKPLFLTLGLFIAMLFGLVVHWFVLLFRIPFPGYDFNYMERSEHSALQFHGSKTAIGMYAYLIIPAVCDIAANILCLMGLQFVNVSTFQLLRGSGIIFISLIKQFALKQHLYLFHWAGVFWNVISVVLVGSTAILGSSAASVMIVGSTTGQGERLGGDTNVVNKQTVQGMLLIMAGTFVRAIQFVVEEQNLKTTVPAPLWVGMKGLWGILLCVFVVFPIGYNLPGDDNGSYEDPFHTWSTLDKSPKIQVAFIMYCCTAFVYSLLGAILAFVLSSVWRAILDNFRSITVWVTSLFIYYCLNPSFGEMWTRYSYLQIVGLAILIYGTAIYNAPNNCSILLEGQWWALGIDLSAEYEGIRREQMADVDAHLVYENLAEEYDSLTYGKDDKACKA